MKRLAPLGLVIYFAVFGLFFAAIVFGTLNINPASKSKTGVVAAITTRVAAATSITPTVVVLPTVTPVATTNQVLSATSPVLPATPTPGVTIPALALPRPVTPLPISLPAIASLFPVHFNGPVRPVYRADAFDNKLTPFKDNFKFELLDQVTQLRPGVIQVNRTVGGKNPLHTHVMLFDLTAKEFSLQVAVQGDYLSGVAPTSRIASSHDALAAVNGDLFGGTGLPQGLTILDSQVAVSPKHRATFAWSKDNQPFIGYFTSHWTWDSQIIAENRETHPLQQLNTPCKAEQLCIYNDLYASVPNQPGDVKVLVDPNNIVVGITQTLKVKIPDNYQVLWGAGSTSTWLRDNLKVGQPVKIDIHTDEPLDKYQYAVSGGPIFLKNGQFFQDCLCNIGDCTNVPGRSRGAICEEFSLDWKLTHYLDVQMPRVGVGFDKAKQTLIVIEVDGYQPGFSVGIRQDDFARLFTEFGADTAMELDGGGSATMWANGKLVSHPSDGSGSVERWVPNALLFYWNSPSSKQSVSAKP